MREADRGAMLQQKPDAGERTPRPTVEHSARPTSERPPRPATEGTSRPSTSPAPAPSPARNRVKRRTDDTRPSTATDNAEEQRPSTPPTPIGITGGTFGFSNSPTKRKPALNDMSALHEVAGKGKGRAVDQWGERAVEEAEDDAVIAVASEGRVVRARSIGKGDAGNTGKGDSGSTGRGGAGSSGKEGGSLRSATHSADVPAASWRCFCDFDSICRDESITILEYSDNADEWDLADLELESGVDIGLEAAPTVALFFVTPTVREHFVFGAQERDPETSECEFAAPRHSGKSSADDECGGRAAADDERGGIRGAGRFGFVATATAGHEFVVTHCAGAPGAGLGPTPTVYSEDADVEGIVDFEGVAGATKDAGVEYEAENGKFVDERVGEDESVGSVVGSVGVVFAAVQLIAATGAELGVIEEYDVAVVAESPERGVVAVPDADPRWMSESDARRINETEGRRALEGEPISLGVRGQQMLRSPEGSSAHTSRAPSPLARSASASVASLGQSGPGARGDRDVKPPPLSTTPAGSLPQRGRGPHAGGVDLGTVEVVSRAARDTDPDSVYSPQRMVASASMGSPRHASLAPFPSSASVEAAEAPPRPKKSVRRTASMTLPSLLLHKPLLPSTLSPNLPSGLFTPRRDKSSSSSGSPQEASCSTSLPATPGPGTPSSGAGTPSTPSKSGLFGLGRSFGFGRKAKDELDLEREKEKEREREAEQVKEWEREREKDKRRPNVLKRRSSATRSGLGAELRVDSPPPQESMRLERIDSSGAEEQRLQEVEKEPAPIFGVPIDPRRGLSDEEPAAASLETPPRKAPIYESFRRREAPKETHRQDTLSPPPMSPPQNFRSLHRSPSSPMMMLNPWSPPSPQAPLPEPHHASTRSAGALSEMSRASSSKDASPRPSFSSDSRRSFSREAHKRGHTPAVPSSSTFGPFGTLGPFDAPDAEGMPSRDRRDTGTSVGSRSTAMYTSDGRRDSEWESRRNTTFTIDDKLDSEVWRKTPTLSDRLSLTLDSYYVTPPSASTNDEHDAARGVTSFDSTLDRPQTPTKKLARRPSMLDVNIESPEISMEGAFDSLASRQSKDDAVSTPDPPPAEATKPEEPASSRTESLEQARPLPSALTIQPSFRRVRAADEETLLIPPRESVATLSPSSVSEGQPFTPVHAVHGEGFDMIARLAKEEAVHDEIEEVPRRERRGTVAGVEVEVSIGPSEALEAQQDERKPVQLERAESPFGTQREPNRIRTTPLVKGATPKPEKEEGSPHLPYFTVFGGISPLASTSSAFVTSAFGTKGSGPTSPNIFSSKRRPQSPRASSPPARPSHGTSKSFSEKGLARKLSTRYLRAHDDIDTYTKPSVSTPEKESSKSRSASYEEEARKSGERQRAQLTKRNRKSEPPGALLSAADGSSGSQNGSSGGSRIWRLVKRISTGALRDKADWDEENTKAPPVPAIPSHLREGSAFIGGPRQSDEARSTKSKARPLPVNRPGNSSPEVESSVDDKFFAGTRRSSVSSVDPSDSVGKPILPPSELGRIAREMEAERQSTRERSKSSTSSNSMRSAQSTRTRSSSGRGQGHARTDTEFTIIATSPSEELTALNAPPPRRRKDDDLAEFGAAVADSPMIPSFSVDQPINTFNRAKMHTPSKSAQRNLSLPLAPDSPPSLPPPRSKTRPSLQETRETGRLQSPHAHSFSTSALKRSKAPPVTFRELGSSPAASRSLSEKEKAARWDDLLLMSERAGGTIHLGSEGRGWHARTTAPPDQFFLDGRQLVFPVAVKAPDESAHILLAVIEPGQLFSPVPTGPFPVDINRGVAIDEKGNLRTLSAEDYQGLTALAHGVDALQDSEVPGSTWRMGSSPEDQSTYELSVSVLGRLQGLSGNPVLRQTRVYAYGRENTKLTMQLPPALVEIFELAEEARVDGEPNEDMLGWVKNTLSSTSIPNLTPKQVANAVAAIRDATSGHAHIAPVINLEPKASYPPKETPRIPIHGMLGVRIPGAPDVPGRHAALDSLEPWSRPPNRRNWLGLGGLGEVRISYPVARAGKKLTMSTVRAEYGRDADGMVILWPTDATGVFYLDEDAPDATVRFRLTKTGEHAAFEEGEDIRGPDGERWSLRLHRPLQQGVVAKLPGITQDPRFAREEDMQPHTQDAPDATSTTHSPGTSSAPSSSTSRPSSSADANPSPPSDSPDPSPTSDSPPSAVPFRLPFPAGTLGYLYYHAHPEAPVLASGIRFRVVPDGKRWEEGWDLDSAMGDAVGEGVAVGEDGAMSRTRKSAEGHTPLVPWELTLAHAASFPGPWAWRFQDAMPSAAGATSISAGEPPSTQDSAGASVQRKDGVEKVVDGDEEDAATEEDDAALEDDDVALEDEGETDGEEDSGTAAAGGSAGSIPRRHYVLTPHTTRVMVDLTFGAWPAGSTGKVLAKFEIADDGRSADGEPSRPVVLALRVLREIEPVVVPGIWEPTPSNSPRLEGQILWHVPLDGPIPEATLLNMPRSAHVNAIFERARAAYFAQGLATKETKRQPGRPRKDGEDVVSARKEKLTVEEFESKYPPIPRRGVCAPLDVAILNQQRAALRALALTKTLADLTTWFQGGPDNESHAPKTSYDPTPLLVHRIADWVDPKSGLVHNVQEPVETDVDFLSRPQVFPRGPALHTQRAANRIGHGHLPLSRVDPLDLGLTAVSLVGRRRARGAVARLRRKTRAATLREIATSEKALEHGPASSVPSIDGAAANGQKAQTQDADSEGREGVTRTRAERSAAWARVLAEYRARREQQEREKEERRNERKRRREEKREEEQERRRLRQQKQREKDLLKLKQAEEREARKQVQQEQARSAIAQRTRALDIQRLHLTRASQWLERAGAYLDEAEADASGDAERSDRHRTPLAGFAATTSLTVAVARATVMIRQASRHLVRARLALRSSNSAVQRLLGPLERASCPVPPRARFVVSTLAADKITDLDRVDLGRIGQRKREAFIEWERRKMEVELKQEDWVGELRGRPTKGPGVVALHHPEWTHNGLLIPANTLDRRIKRRGTRLLIDDGDESGTDVPSFPPAEGFFYWYEGPDGPPGLRFRLASKGTAFVNGQDWVPGGVDGVPWVYPATKAVRHGRLFPWLRADNVLSPAVEASASLALRRSWYKSSLRKAASHIVHHLLPQNLTEADRMCFSGCTAAIAVSGAEYAMPNIELDRRRRRMACHSKRAAICVLVMGGGGLLSLDPTKLKEDDRLDLDGFKYYEAWFCAGVRRWVVRSAVGGTMSAELRFRLVPPGTSFWDGRDLERAGRVWRCGLRILCKWQPATMAALADAGHIPRAFYEEARTAVGLSRLHQGFVLEDDYDETGSRPLRWRYPSVIKRLALKDPRAARFRRRGPRVSYQRRVPRYKSPRRLSLMEHKQVSTLDPSKLTEADRVDARDLRGIVLSVPSGAGTEDKPIEVNILAPRTGRFPLDAIGFIYWHDPPNRPPWGGAFRFRVAPPGTAFADGHDLVSPTIGIPYEWGVSWALARFEHNPDDPNRLHLRIQKLLSPPVPRFPDYDGFVPPPREGELVMMNTETPWEYVYDRKRPFEDYATALDLFWTDATCRADYVREAGGEEQWKEEWVQPRRRTRGRKKPGR
ncbi:hypothetical protein EV121DRAFT_284511 [Schizophyllum commune]